MSETKELTGGGAISRRLLLISTAFGVLGAALLWLYLHRFEEQMSGGRRVQLLTVLQPIERGALITDAMLGVYEVPLAYVERRAVRAVDKSKVLGIRSAHSIDVQSTLMWSDLSLSAESRDLASLVQPGKRAVSVRASEAGSDPAGNGLVRPGHYVDVFATFRESPTGGSEPISVVLLQRVLVLAVGSETEPQGFGDAKGTAAASFGHERELTLSLKMEEAQLLSLARARGVISVALRSVDDNKIVEAVPDMPGSVLMDKTRRHSVQRKSAIAPSDAPMRLTERTQ